MLIPFAGILKRYNLTLQYFGCQTGAICDVLTWRRKFCIVVGIYARKVPGRLETSNLEGQNLEIIT